MNKENIKKVVLAYSGGLDTSIIIPWLKENYNNCEVIAVSGNVGQADELEGLEEKAIKTGASKLIVADLVDEMVDEIIIPALKMDAKYETYLLGTAFARPVIGKKLAEIAKEMDIRRKPKLPINVTPLEENMRNWVKIMIPRNDDKLGIGIGRSPFAELLVDPFLLLIEHLLKNRICYYITIETHSVITNIITVPERDTTIKNLSNS